MKKISSFLTILFAVSFAAHAQTVGSANIMGYTKVIQEDGLQLTISPFVNGTLNDWAPTTGVGGDGLGNADNIHVYTLGQGYKNYFFAGDVGDPQYNYKWIDYDTTTVATNIINEGASIWYRSRMGDTNEVLYSGDVIMDDAIITPIQEGLQLISFPYSASVDLNNMGLTNGIGGDGLGNADNVHLYIPGEGYKNYFFAGDVGDPQYNYKWIDYDTTTVATNKISMGTGFWYRCRKENGFDWTVQRPYLND